VSLLPDTVVAAVAADDREPDGVGRGMGLLLATADLPGTSADQGSSEPTPAPEAEPGGLPSPAASAERRAPDWDGIWRDTVILAGAQAAAAAVLFVTPESVSNWSREDKKSTFRQYDNNFANPEVDDDQLYLNYVLHPYWGAAYYIRGRERGLDQASSFVFSALISAMYEFGIECIFENPSIQDLIVTPVAGSLLGAYVFEPWRESIKRKEELRWYDHAALIATDPIGLLSLGIEKWFGIESTITVRYSVPPVQRDSSMPAMAPGGSRIAVVMTVPFK
jgi:hypothetical protein